MQHLATLDIHRKEGRLREGGETGFRNIHQPTLCCIGWERKYFETFGLRDLRQDSRDFVILYFFPIFLSKPNRLSQITWGPRYWKYHPFLYNFTDLPHPSTFLNAKKINVCPCFLLVFQSSRDLTHSHWWAKTKKNLVATSDIYNFFKSFNKY